MGRSKTLIEKLREFKADASRSFSIEKMIWFGSRAKGRSHKWSDIDLIVVSGSFRRVRPLNRGLALYDHWRLNYPVDFLCYTPEEFSRAKKRVSLASEAAKNGITI